MCSDLFLYYTHFFKLVAPLLNWLYDPLIGHVWKFQNHWLRLITAHTWGQDQMQTPYCCCTWGKSEVVIEESTTISLNMAHSAFLLTLSYMSLQKQYWKIQVLSSHFEMMWRLSACLELRGHIQNGLRESILCKAPTENGHRILLKRTNRRINTKRRQKRYN